MGRAEVRRGLRVLWGTAALVAGLVLLGLLPLASPGADDDKGGKGDGGDAVEQVTKKVEETKEKVEETTQQVTETAEQVTGEEKSSPSPSNTQTTRDPPSGSGSPQRSSGPIEAARETDEPETEPPLHGTNPHGQGTVGVVDFLPSSERPLGGNPNGSDSGEEIVFGRARGEQTDGGYHGHVTVLSLFGVEPFPVDTDEGEQESGPVAPLQAFLNAICEGGGGTLCLTLLTADSETTKTGSQNHFQGLQFASDECDVVALQLDLLCGIRIILADSRGNIEEDDNCQTAEGSSTLLHAQVGLIELASVGNSSSTSTACRNGNDSQQNSSSFITSIAGQQVPFPAQGCADGTPDTVVPLGLVEFVCNADDSNGLQADHPYGVREALSVFALPLTLPVEGEVGGLQLGGEAVIKGTVAASESAATAPDPDPDPDRPRNRGGDDDDDDDDDDVVVAQAALDFDPSRPGAGATSPSPSLPLGSPSKQLGGSRNPLTERQLPFTGAEVLAWVIGGLLLVGGGMWLRRRLPAD